jgi:septal ring factor EnvC (AmiA/AmiB activator)
LKDTKPKNNKLSSSSSSLSINVIENSNKFDKDINQLKFELKRLKLAENNDAQDQHEKLTQQLQARDSDLAALKDQLKIAQDKVLQLTSDNDNLVQKLSKFVKEEQNEDINHFVAEKCSYKEIFET